MFIILRKEEKYRIEWSDGKYRHLRKPSIDVFDKDNQGALTLQVAAFCPKGWEVEQV